MEKPETVFEEEDWYSVIHGCLELEEVIKEQYALIQEGLANIPKPGRGPSGKQSRLQTGDRRMGKLAWEGILKSSGTVSAMYNARCHYNGYYA